jgi:hypothetical protein
VGDGGGEAGALGLGEGEEGGKVLLHEAERHGADHATESGLEGVGVLDLLDLLGGLLLDLSHGLLDLGDRLLGLNLGSLLGGGLGLLDGNLGDCLGDLAELLVSLLVVADVEARAHVDLLDVGLGSAALLLLGSGLAGDLDEAVGVHLNSGLLDGGLGGGALLLGISRAEGIAGETIITRSAVAVGAVRTRGAVRTGSTLSTKSITRETIIIATGSTVATEAIGARRAIGTGSTLGAKSITRETIIITTGSTVATEAIGARGTVRTGSTLGAEGVTRETIIIATGSTIATEATTTGTLGAGRTVGTKRVAGEAIVEITAGGTIRSPRGVVSRISPVRTRIIAPGRSTGRTTEVAEAITRGGDTVEKTRIR